MINFRYHVISLTAVFLALALGITMGSTFLHQPFVTGLESQVDIAERKVKDRNSEIDRLRAELERSSKEDSAMLTAGLAEVASGPLNDQHVAIVTVAGTATGVIDQLVALLSAAGAQVPAVVTATDQMDLDDAKQSEAVAAALGLTGTDEADRSAAILEQLAAALVGSTSNDTSEAKTTTTAESTTAPGAPSSTTLPATSSTTSPSAPGASTTGNQPTTASSTSTTTTAAASTGKSELSTVLSRLSSAGFVDIETPDDPGGEFDAMPKETKVIIVVGEGQELDAQQLMLPLAETAALNHPGGFEVASAINPGNRAEDATNERVALRSSIIADFRDSGVLDGKVTTIDNLDAPAGQMAAVLSITAGQVGDFGIADGATAVLPGQD